jgi:hypothetical protein
MMDADDGDDDNDDTTIMTIIVVVMMIWQKGTPGFERGMISLRIVPVSIVPISIVSMLIGPLFHCRLSHGPIVTLPHGPL